MSANRTSQFTGTIWDYVYVRAGNMVVTQFLNQLGLDAFVLVSVALTLALALLMVSITLQLSGMIPNAFERREIMSLTMVRFT